MAPEPATHDDASVLSVIDESAGEPRLVIADVTCDDRWVLTPAADAVTLLEWR